MTINKSIKIYFDMFKWYITYFFGIMGVIVAVNFVLNSFFNNIGNITINVGMKNLPSNFVLGSLIFAFIYALLSPTYYNDIMMTFSIPKNAIIKTQNIYNLIVLAISTTIFNLSLLSFDVYNRLNILLISFFLIYTLINTLNFFSFIGKRFNWMFVIGYLLIFITIYLSFMNYIIMAIAQGFYIFHFVIGTIIMNVILIFFNSRNFKKIDLIR
ncbi:MAG: hypothetical protein ACQESN_04665 [Thermotogota bacterium]